MPTASTENLRLGPDYNPPQPRDALPLPERPATPSPARALRCVGVGECRREGGRHVPQLQVTREEKHSTRGRAHLLFEMMNGEVLTDGWKSEPVKEALDLCLACKGCKGDCPVNVDMATYKAEFLSHYYEGRLRPRHAYAMGLIYWWARLASLAPRRWPTSSARRRACATSPSGSAASRQQRRMPPFARQTFKDWFRRAAARNQGEPPVILWPDTFNNYFHPEIAKAAVEVLETAGYQVLGAAGSRCAAAGRCTTSACSTRPRRCCARSWTRCSRRSRPAFPSSVWSRAASPSSATS